MTTATPTNYASASLYVGDLSPEVTEAMLFDIFKQVGPVASIRVCRDSVTRRSLGYAYVNFHNVQDAERALDTLNYSKITDRCCRIMWSYRDPARRKSGVGNVFIKNLDKSIDHQLLFDTFSAFGNILSCKVETDFESGESKGYGYVHYETEEEADAAISKVNGMQLADQVVYVSKFKSRKERETEIQNNFTNVFVKNLPEDTEKEKIQEVFSKFGEIQSAVIMTKEDDEEESKSKGFGFINFTTTSAAKDAVENMNGNTEAFGQEIYVGRAQKKSERLQELKNQYEQRKQENMQKYQGVNLYIKNLDDTITEDTLRKEFAHCGNITSTKIMRDERNNSRGFGFVCFGSPEEATKATEMNGTMLAGKPIYVALAQRKDIRRAQLEAQHAQKIAGMRLPNGMPNMYGGPQVFYPQTAGAPRMVYQAGLVPRQRWQAGQQAPGLGRQSNYPPMAYNGMQMGGPPRNQRPQQRGPRVPQGQQNQGAKNRTNSTGNQRQAKYNGVGPAGARPQYPNQQQNTGSSVIPGGLTAELAQKEPEEAKGILGDKIFTVIQESQPELAGKITGMFLELLDNSELILLLTEPESLEAKVNEAIDTLKSSGQLDQEGHLVEPAATEGEAGEVVGTTA